MGIHFLTVHWGSDEWINVQIAQIRKYTRSEFETYAFVSTESRLNGLFTHVFFEPIREHWIKLNLLAHMACLHAKSDEDWLVFVDSDAFPIAPWEDVVRELLLSNELVAIRRDENLGDQQPHPCFCVTTVGFWRRIRGDWAPGFRWKNALGKSVTDVGGNLLGQLLREEAQWHPIKRSASCHRHPLFFGVYGGIVYHHGAGSRSAFSRLDHHLLECSYSKSRMLFLRLTRQRRRRVEVAAKENGRISAAIKEHIERDATFLENRCREVGHV